MNFILIRQKGKCSRNRKNTKSGWTIFSGVKTEIANFISLAGGLHRYRNFGVAGATYSGILKSPSSPDILRLKPDDLLPAF